MISHGAFDECAIFPTHFIHFDIEARATQEQCTGLKISSMFLFSELSPPMSIEYGECLVQSTQGWANS